MKMFYKDKGIFLTGGTGFFGKSKRFPFNCFFNLISIFVLKYFLVIIEKLLRVTDVGQIYLLIRSKKGKDVYTRLDDIFNDPVSSFAERISLLYCCHYHW